MLEPVPTKPSHATAQPEYYINVLQGRGARLELNSLAYTSGKIVGLHTHDFSFCSIVILSSRKKLVMFHVDRLSVYFFVEKFAAEVMPVINEQHDVFIWGKESAANTTKIIEDLLNQIMPSITLQKRIVSDNITGLILSFSNKKDPNSLPGVSLYSGNVLPDNILFHPNEEQLMTVRVIEGMIGRRAILATGDFKNCQSYIFDGLGWVVLPPHEYDIDARHDLTKEEMSHFHFNDAYFTTVDNLSRIFLSKETELVSVSKKTTDEAVKLTARHLENYLNNYDAYKIFQTNMIYILKKFSDNELTQEDFNWKNKLLVAVEAIAQKPDQILTVYGRFCKSSATISFKQEVIEKFNILYRHLEARLLHKSHRQVCMSVKEKANKCIKAGVSLMQAQENLGAKSLLVDAMSEALRSCFQSDNNLVGAHSHLATCLYRLGSYTEAISHFNRAIDLYENYFDTSDSIKKKIETLHNGVKACQVKINEARNTDQKAGLPSPMP